MGSYEVYYRQVDDPVNEGIRGHRYTFSVVMTRAKAPMEVILSPYLILIHFPTKLRCLLFSGWGRLPYTSTRLLISISEAEKVYTWAARNRQISRRQQSSLSCSTSFIGGCLLCIYYTYEIIIFILRVRGRCGNVVNPSFC